MNVDGIAYRSVWRDGDRVGIIDQTRLPYEFSTLRLGTADEVAHAIRTMQVRGAPLIGATAAFGLALAMRADAGNEHLAQAAAALLKTRPTAVNLHWAVERMLRVLKPLAPAERTEAAWTEAVAIADEDIELNRAIGRHGLALLREIARRHERVNVLTHCNAGWLATVDYGTALAPIYLAHDEGIDVHVWVDETRPRNQGLLTAWELASHGVPHTLIADNAGGHLMQHGEVDLIIVGADRVTGNGDVCNKIGTYLKALAANDNGVPFYAAVPSPTIDWTIADALRDIPIEQRSTDELAWVQGRDEHGAPARLRTGLAQTPVSNPAFDITPARLVSGLITERGIADSPQTLRALFGQDAARASA